MPGTYMPATSSTPKTTPGCDGPGAQHVFDLSYSYRSARMIEGVGVPSWRTSGLRGLFCRSPSFQGLEQLRPCDDYLGEEVQPGEEDQDPPGHAG